MRRLKWVLTGIVVLLVAVVVAGIAVLKSLDLNQYRGLIAQQIESITGRKVVIGGPIELELSFSPALALADVSLANAAWGSKPQMVSVRRFEAKVALLPLLSRTVRIDRIVLDGANILLETDAHGVGNWVFQPPGGAAAQPAPTTPTPTPAPETTSAGGGTVNLPSFNDISITQSVLTYRDGRGGKVTIVQIEKLQLLAPSDSTPMQIDLDGRYNETPVQAKGTLGPVAKLVAGEPAAIDLELQAAGAKIRLLGDLGRPGADKGSDVVVTAEGSELGQLSALAGTEVPALGPYKVTLRVQEAKGVVAANGIQGVIGRDDLVVASLTGNVADVGHASGINLQMEVKGPSLAALNRPAKMALPATGLYQVSAAVTGGGGAYRLQNLAATIGGSDLAGEVALTLGGARPKIEASLGSMNLNMSDLTGKSGPSQPDQKTRQAGDGKVFPADPLPFAALKAIDANVRFTARSLTIQKEVLEKVDLTAVIDNGHLSIQPAQAGVSGGTVTLKADVDAGPSPPKVGLAVTSRQVEVGSLLRLLHVSDVLSGGKADLDTAVDGSGDSVRAIMADLNGSSRLVMGPGRIDNGFAKLLLADLGGLVTLSGSGDSSNINCMVSDFVITRGDARARGLVLDTNGVTIIGSGNIDLASERLRLRFDPSAKQTNLASLAVPVKVGGTLASPSVTPDPGAIAQNLVGTVTNAPANVFGALAGLTGAKAEKAPQNPCAAALGPTDAKGKSTSTSPAPATGSGSKSTGGSTKSGIEGFVGGVSKSLDSLLGGTGSGTGGSKTPKQ